ncbi:MAG TPA: DUF4383 domain-containing protein [Pseudonocardiaceae bacterium]|jgi:predicted Abi (CAAX) family protease|nr:DUF4383 domain-containing protein [Pseudonocardiaceae bacterium]
MAAIPAAKWGIRYAGYTGAKTVPQKFALIVGIVYVALGVIGFFVTGFSEFVGGSNGVLLGLFHLNPFRNVVHIALGALALLAALVLTPPATEGVNFIFAGILIVVAVLGYLGYLQGLLGIPPGVDPDNVLYLVLGVVTLFFSNPAKVLTG